MKPFVVAATSVIVVAVAASTGYNGAKRLEAARAPISRPSESLITLHQPTTHTIVSADELTKVVQKTCTGCHNDGLLVGGMSLDSFRVADAAKHPQLAEKMITKLRAGMMPPPGEERPSADTLEALVSALETT